MPFCNKCGTENPDDASICASCGNNLNQKPDLPSSGSGSSNFLDKIQNCINKLMLFFDSGEFFKISWRWLFYHLLAVIYALLPVALIVAAIKINVFSDSAKTITVFFIAFIFLTVACFLSFLAIFSRAKNFDEVTKEFSASKVTLSNFYDFFKVACVHSLETTVYAFGIFTSIVIFGLAFCGMFTDPIRNMFSEYIMLGFVAGPLIAYFNIFATKVVVLFLKVFLEYLPKLFTMPIRALYNLFGLIIDARHNLWKRWK